MDDDNRRRAAPRSTWAAETRRKQNAWKKQNRATIACDLSRDIADSFRGYCAAQGRSVSAVLADYIYSIVGRPEDRRAATDPTEDRAAPPASSPTDPTDGDRRTGGPEDSISE